jgi:predicted dehydrogenase
MHPRLKVAALVDVDLQRANLLRRRHSLNCIVSSDYNTVLKELDAVIIALPNHLHAPAILAAARAGVHILCEKPLALSAAEARECAAVAGREGVLLAVGMQWRFRDGGLLLPLVLDEGLLGPLVDYDWQYGHKWDWPTSTGFYFSRPQAGGGVLIDAGVHLLDSLIQCFGPVSQFEYMDDNWGSGIEANAVLTLCHRGRYGEVRGRVRLSRTFTLQNRLLVRGQRAEAEIHATDPGVLVVHRVMGGCDTSDTFRMNRLETAPKVDPFYHQLDNFVESIRGNQKLVSDGCQAVEVMDLIEQCYAQARRISEPWCEI